MNYGTQSETLRRLLGLTSEPVAVLFRPEAPAGVPPIEKAGPAGCSYWSLAAEGKVFYTRSSDHTNCPIGAHTHAAEMSAEKGAELQSLIGQMVELNYMQMAEVPLIPRRATPLQVAVYAPLSRTPEQPDVVLVRGSAKQIMLLSEAMQAAGLNYAGGTMGRPTCAMIPAAIHSGQGVTSLGCIGNRVYTGIEDNDMYTAIPGGQCAAVIAKLDTIVTANKVLEQFHRDRQETLAR